MKPNSRKQKALVTQLELNVGCKTLAFNFKALLADVNRSATVAQNGEP